MTKRPNVVVLMADDHGQWASGCYGNRVVRTPSIDWLAENGVRFANAFTPSPVCSPARMSFFSGRIPSQHGVHDWIYERDEAINATRWLDDEVMLGTLFQQAGYATALVGKWHGGQSDQPQPGFDYWFNYGRGWMQNHHEAHVYFENGQAVTRAGFKSQVVTDVALRWIAQQRARAAEQPFFLFLGFNTTHNPWRDHPERLVAQYRRGTFDEVADGLVYPFGSLTGEATIETRFNRREALAQYYAAVSEMDEQIGRVVDTLFAEGLLADTLVVYSGDHGLCGGQHGIWGKGDATIPYNVVEESVRIPLLFYQRGRLFGGQVRQEFVDHTDTFLTLLAAAGIEAPAGRNYAGRSLWPTLTEGKAVPKRYDGVVGDDYQVFEYASLRAVRDARYKLVTFNMGAEMIDTPDWLLFDLVADPGETVNLYGQPGMHEIAGRLWMAIQQWFTVYGAAGKDWQAALDGPMFNPWEAWRPPPDQRG